MNLRSVKLINVLYREQETKNPLQLKRKQLHGIKERKEEDKWNRSKTEENKQRNKRTWIPPAEESKGGRQR